MFEANVYIMKCPFCGAPMNVKLIQVATHELVNCTNCKKEIRLVDKNEHAKRAIADSFRESRQDKEL